MISRLILLNTTPKIFFKMVNDTDHRTPETGLTPSIVCCKNDSDVGGTGFSATGLGVVNEVGAGWYAYTPDSSEVDALGMMGIRASASGADDAEVFCQIVAFDPEDQLRLGLNAIPNANAGEANGLPTIDATGTVHNSPVTLASDQLDLIINGVWNANSEDYSVANSVGNLLLQINTSGMVLAETQPYAVTFTQGVVIEQSQTDEPGLKITGNGVGHGLLVQGGDTGAGAVFSGGVTSGDGIRSIANGGGHGAALTGVGTGCGLAVTGGASPGAHGAQFLGGTSSGGSGLFLGGDYAGSGLSIVGGEYAAGMTINAGGLGDGDGLRIGASGTGHDVDLTGSESIRGNVTGTIGGMSASGWAQAFTLDSEKTFSDAIAGSVVKEIVDNVSGSGNWTTTEKSQIRYRLGLDGDTDTPFASPALPVTVLDKSEFTLSGTVTTLDDLLTALNTAHGSGSWTTATGFSTHSANDVWSVGTRELTAGTNIVLEKGTGITGFNDLSAAEVNSEADAALADIGLTTTITDRIDVAISSRLATDGYTAPDNSGIAAVMAKTDNLPESPAAVGSAMTLADGAITDAKFTVPALTGPATGPVGYLYQLWRRFFKKAVYNAGANELTTFANDGSTVITTQTLTDSSGVQTQGPAT